MVFPSRAWKKNGEARDGRPGLLQTGDALLKSAWRVARHPRRCRRLYTPPPQNVCFLAAPSSFFNFDALQFEDLRICGNGGCLHTQSLRGCANRAVKRLTDLQISTV
jgi:hypothetical protein